MSNFAGWSNLASPQSNVRVAVLDPNDTATSPANANGSNKTVTLQNLASALTVQGNLSIALRPSGDTSGVADAAAINAAIAALNAFDGGVVKLASGIADWNIECGQVSGATGTYIDAAGCWINARGAGDVFRFVDTSSYSGRDYRGAGIIGRPVIDGTHTTGNSSGVHAGDILGLMTDVQVQNFTAGTTSKGVWFDNQNYWTEQLKGRIFAQNCTQHVVFDVSGTPAVTATGSFDRGDVEIYVEQVGTGNDGVVFQNGTYIIDGRLVIRGNFNGAASAPSTAVLRLTGVAGGSRPDNGQYSRLVSCQLDIGTECDTTVGNTNGPFTIVAGASGNQISACYGLLDFSAAGNFFQVSNLTASNFSYQGRIAGDANLAAIPWAFTRTVSLSGGSDTSGTATESAPSFTTATSKQLSTVQDVELYVCCGTSIAATIAFGPTNTPAYTLVNNKTLAAGQVVSFRVPKGWYVEITCLTMADLSFIQVTC